MSMNGWKEYVFSDFVDINPKVALKANQQYSFVEMKDLEPNNKFCLPSQNRVLAGGARFNNGDTLFARITPCLENGKICQVKGLENNLGFGSTEFLVFRGKKDVSDSDFVYYLSRWDEVRSYAEINLHGTSGRQRVPREVFDKYTLLFPLLPEQEAIAEVLSSLDDKIDLLHRNNKTLEQLAETLFRQWFIEEAEQTILSEEFNITMGQSPPGHTYNEDAEGLKFFQGRTDFGFRFPDERVYCTQPTRIASPFDTLLSVRAPVGDVNIIDEKCCIGRGVAAIRHKNKKIHYSYTYYTLRHLSQLFDTHEDTGTIFGSINKDELSNIDCVKLDTNKVDFYNTNIGSLDDKIYNNCVQIKQLEKLRDTLLPKLMSGEVRVQDIKTTIPA